VSAPTLLPTGPIAERPRLLGVGAWDALVVLSGVVLMLALDARGHFHAEVRLSHTRWLSAPSFVTLLAAAAIASAFIGRRHEIIGLTGLAGVSFGFAAFWLLLGDHRFAGPVIADLSADHGIHAGDLLAGVPIVAGLALLALAARRLGVGRPLSRRAQLRRAQVRRGRVRRGH
jgi:hypothetical protein